MMSNCPWDSWREIFGLPNIFYCERKICSWIENPANSWSNLAYIVAGLLLLAKSRDKHLGIPLILVGVFSFFYHASHNLLSQYFDYLGMFFFLAVFQVLRNPGKLLPRLGLGIYANAGLRTAAWIAVMYGVALVSFPYQWLIVVFALWILFQEKSNFSKSHSLKIALGTIIVGELCSILDIKRIWCDADSWLQGHACWHILGGISLYFLSKYNEECPLQLGEGERISNV